jgi:hypothetical protein
MCCVTEKLRCMAELDKGLIFSRRDFGTGNRVLTTACATPYQQQRCMRKPIPQGTCVSRGVAPIGSEMGVGAGPKFETKVPILCPRGTILQLPFITKDRVTSS